MRNTRHYLSTLLALIITTVTPVLVRAQGFEFDPGGRIGKETGLSKQGDLPTVVINITNIALGLMGLIATTFIIYGGYRYLTAGGNDENVQNAKAVIKNAVIGLVIVLLSYAIVSFFFYSTVNVTQPAP